jgi:beta-glucosidase
MTGKHLNQIGRIPQMTKKVLRSLTLAAAVMPLGGVAVLAPGSTALAQHAAHTAEASHPWMNKALSPEQRSEMVLKEMTLDEKIELLHGNGMPGWGTPEPNEYLGNGGAGFVLGIPRLGLPFIQMSDAAYGVRSSADNGRYSTALPSNLASAASWDPQAACSYGALIGSELRAQGYNMTLGGGTNITREPRNGRTFEYLGEDPVLAGTLVGNRIKCEQAQHVVGDIKHYAVNDQESGRNEVNSIIDKRSMREGDLLAFEIGVKVGDPAAVMCSYNAVNGNFACENKYLLTDVLRKDFHFKGFVLSDWGGTHSTVNASHAGLDNEEPLYDFYGPKLKEAVQNGSISMDELNSHVLHMLYGEFVSGIVDHPIQRSVIDVEANLAISRHIAEQSTVLLKNEGSVLPLDRNIHSIAVIGENADMGMISGGGSAQVDPPGRPSGKWQEHIWFPTSPLKAITAKAPGAQVRFASGKDLAEAAALAKSSDVVLVFAYQWESEGMDLKNLSLPDNQDALIEAVAKANPKTVVVLETGTAVTMPWVNQVSGVVEAWFAGSKGADAVANVLFGDVNPSAKLPMTFPRTEADLPHPALVIPPPGALGKEAVLRTGKPMPTFSVTYDEGLKVGYKWYDAEHKDVLFPFGYGLSYTTYSYSGLQVTAGHEPTVRFTVKNTGSRAGQDVAEIYASLPEGSGEPPKRLVGFSKVALAPGESKEVSVSIDPKYLSIFDVDHDAWKLLPGSYTIMVGGSSKALDLSQKLELQ